MSIGAATAESYGIRSLRIHQQTYAKIADTGGSSTVRFA
jgi:hypothetical protein